MYFFQDDFENCPEAGKHRLSAHPILFHSFFISSLLLSQPLCASPITPSFHLSTPSYPYSTTLYTANVYSEFAAAVHNCSVSNSETTEEPSVSGSGDEPTEPIESDPTDPQSTDGATDPTRPSGASTQRVNQLFLLFALFALLCAFF